MTSDFASHVVLLQPGYEGVRELNFEDKVVILLVKIKKGDDGPVFVSKIKKVGKFCRIAGRSPK